MEKNKSKNFFSRVQYAVFKVEKYGDFIEEKPSIAIKYMLTLILIISLILTIMMTISFTNLAKKAENFIKNYLVEFNFENDKLSFSEVQEAYDEEENFYFVANTEDISENELNEYKNKAADAKISLILLSNKAILSTNNIFNEFTYSTLNSNLNLDSLNKEKVVDALNNNGILKLGASMFEITGLSLYFTEIVSVGMNIILLFIFGYLMCKFISVPLNVGNVFNISVYSITLSIILGFVYNFVNYFVQFEIPYFDTLYLLIAYIYVVSAIFIIKSDLLKQKVELQKIVEVQKEVAKELQEQKEKDEEKKKQKDDEKQKKNEDNKEEEPANTEPDGSEI